jgi:hypothetical protein
MDWKHWNPEVENVPALQNHTEEQVLPGPRLDQNISNNFFIIIQDTVIE